jgi:hypothetical protein
MCQERRFGVAANLITLATPSGNGNHDRKYSGFGMAPIVERVSSEPRY